MSSTLTATMNVTMIETTTRTSTPTESWSSIDLVARYFDCQPPVVVLQTVMPAMTVMTNSASFVSYCASLKKRFSDHFPSEFAVVPAPSIAEERRFEMQNFLCLVGN